jgi:hypothetical protein
LGSGVIWSKRPFSSVVAASTRPPGKWNRGGTGGRHSRRTRPGGLRQNFAVWQLGWLPHPVSGTPATTYAAGRCCSWYYCNDNQALLCRKNILSNLAKAGTTVHVAATTGDAHPIMYMLACVIATHRRTAPVSSTRAPRAPTTEQSGKCSGG